MPTLKGRVQAVIHHSNDYYILAFEPENGKSSKPFKACGHICGLDSILPGVTLQLAGDFITHPKYGSQFSFYGWKPWAPTPYGVSRFLQECVPGFFDPAATKTVVDTFGLETFRILCDEPETFLKLESEALTRDRLEGMLQNWEAVRSSYELSIFLQDNDISSHLIRAILEEFGPEARKEVNRNPYRLLSVPGFTFSRVDEIAERMGVASTDIRRLEGAILWCLYNSAQSGHLYVRRGDIPKALIELSNNSDIVPFSFNFDIDIPKAIQNLAAIQAVVIDPEVGLYLPRYYRYERDSAHLLSKFISNMDLEVDLMPFLEEYEKSHDIKLSVQQKEAVEKLLKNKVLVLTGLPGTGKTTVIKTFVSLFQATYINFALMAPTGIASKRLSSVCGHPAATIHRSLGYDGDQWGYSSAKKYPVGAVIVDEMSMVDQELFFRILDSLDPGTILVFVGDDAQLSSVGPGSVLRELLSCPAIANVRLTEIFRQSHTSDIVINSHKINRGETLDFNSPKSESEFQFVSTQNESKVVDLITQMALKLKARDANFQVLSPKYDGIVGVNNLNDRLREVLNPNKGQKEQRFGDLRLREGDRIMIAQNNYDLNVYNGDMAKLLAIEEKDLLLKVHGGGLEGLDSLIRVPKNEALTMLRLAYAITVHKSQGSEFETVIMPIFKTQGRMLQRNLLYTGITRAKKKVWLLGDPIAVGKAIANDKVVHRNTALSKSILTSVVGVSPSDVNGQAEPPSAIGAGATSQVGETPAGD